MGEGGVPLDRGRMEAEIEAELRFHLDEEMERLQAAGCSADEARRQVYDAEEFERARRACVRIGRRRLTRQRWEERMGGLVRDLRYAERRLRRSPGYTSVVVLTLALAVGANTAVFNLVDSVLLRPLPYSGAERLVQVWPEKNFNAALAREVAARARTLESVAGISSWELTLIGEGDPLAPRVRVVHPDYFRVLSATPHLGSFFGPEAGLAGNDAVVVLSHALWMNRFGGDPSVVGRTLELDGYDHERRLVVGVMAEGFVPPTGPADLWVPLRTDPTLTVGQDETWYVNYVIARLAPGASVDDATRDVARVAAELGVEDPVSVTEDDVRVARVRPLADSLVGDIRPTLWALLAVVALVLAIACANLASLALARAESQRRELAVRGSLGATRARLVRHVIAESLVLGSLGGAVGLFLAWSALAFLAPVLAQALPASARIGLSGPVLLFTLGLSVGAGVVVGVGPALRVRDRGLQDDLRAGTQGAGGTRRRSLVNRLLVAGEVALATLVVVTSVAVGRRFVELIRTDPGFETLGVVTVQVPVPFGRYPQGEPQVTFARQVLERVQALPDVERAGFIHLLPLTTANWSFPILADGWEPRADQPLPSENFRVVAGDYFGALGIPLLRGEGFDPTSVGPADENPMLVNEAFARRYFPDGDVLGRTVRLFGNRPHQVIGVVGDVRQFTLDREPLPEMYVPYSTFSPGRLWVMARGSGDLGALGAAIRAAVWEVDPRIPVPTIQTLDAVRADSVARERLVTGLLATFAGLALILGIVGVYGVTAYAARGRRREWGVRLALGARPDGVVRSALATEMTPVVVGAVLGLAVALLAGRVAGSLVSGVDARDPVTLTLVPLALVVAAALAAWLPVRRITRRLDPVAVLRAE
jgi:predicted permease